MPASGLLWITTVISAVVVIDGADGTSAAGPVFLIAAFAAFALLLHREMRRPALRSRDVWLATAALLALAVVIPPQSSRDLWSYAFYGRAVSQYHESPYTHVPAEHPHDPAVERSNRVWDHTPSVYGPAFAAVSAVGMRAAASSPLRMRLFFQGLAALAVLAVLAVLHRRGAPPGALALVGLNPLTVASIVNNGHNDLFVGLAVLGAVLLARDRHGAATGAVSGLACLVKISALLPLGALVFWLWRRDRVAALRAAAAGAAVVLVGYALAGGTAALAPLRTASGHISESSIWDPLQDVHRHGGPVPALVIWLPVALVATIVVVGWQRRSDPVAVTVAAVLAYILAAPYVLPWYVGWILPLLALTWRSRLTRLVIAWSALAMVAYSLRPTMAAPLRSLLEETRGGMPVFETLALLALVVVAWRGRQATEELVPR
jgi:hypothetical protein